jgi:uncharacterized protein YcbK (DUF882 family)
MRFSAVSTRFTKHFAVAELACKDGTPVPEKYYKNAKAICERAEKLRALVGPLTVTSGYRTATHNKRVGGEPKSYHLTASALDLKSYTKTAEELTALYKELIASGEVPDGGLGTYPREGGGWIHIDLGPGGPRRKWKR